MFNKNNLVHVRNKIMNMQKQTLRERVVIQGIIGCVAGLLILHPLAMFIHDIIEDNVIHLITLVQIFSPRHVLMSGYFVVLGGVTGIFRGLYIHNRMVLYEELKRLSITDELTSLYNRRYFDNQLKIELERASRYSHNLSLLIIDLDKFKQFNDTYGHQKGDFVLKEIAEILANSVRKPDFVTRYGGDEFVIVMPETDMDSALRFADRLYARIDAYPFKKLFPGIKDKIMVSIGVATYPEDAMDEAGLFKTADERLYKEKERRSNTNSNSIHVCHKTKRTVL